VSARDSMLPPVAGRDAAGLLLACLLLAACATPPREQGTNDPYEQVNRKTHAFNKGFDRHLFRPAANAYGVVLPEPVREGVNNFSNNLGAPADVVNGMMQGEVEDSVHNMFRFFINTTLGVAGVFDPATSIGLERRSTDFGETLHTWGVGEGAYLEVPFFGPSTQRDFAGDIVDFFTNPTTVYLDPSMTAVTRGAWVAKYTGYRYDFADSVDSVFYESVDSYAQSRQVYLDNRRFELGQTAEEGYVDPYDELFNE
jgi:phospholipid-binding lipoprotein MlaA